MSSKCAAWDPQSIMLLQREASVYWLAANVPGFAALADLLPKYYLFDAMRNALVVELLPEGENLSEYHRRLGKFPVIVAARLGETLGKCHRLTTLDLENTVQPGMFPKQAPWILSAHRTDNSPLNALSGANQQVLGIIQKYSDFHKVLDRLREQWQINTLIHGDMKWDNCVFSGQGESGQVKIVDWETADWGDACWDVGGILQAFLTFWIMSIPMTAGSTPAQFLQNAPYPIEAMQPALRAFWLAYTEARQVRQAATKELLVHSVQYGAARMLHTAYEYMYYSPQITSNALGQLQVSLNILNNPGEAITDLLAL